MSISAAIERTLFKHKNGVGGNGGNNNIIKHRLLSFLIWQSIQSTLLLFFKPLLLSPFTQNPLFPTLLSLLSFPLFHLSLLLHSVSLFFITSPHQFPYASLLEVSFSFFRLVFVSGGGDGGLLRRRVRVSLSFVLFASVCAVVGAVSVACVCWGCDGYWDVGSGVLGVLGVRGGAVGLFYGLHYVYEQRWVLRFPVIQRPPFFSFKMGIPSAVRRALKLSFLGYLFSLLFFLLPVEHISQVSVGRFVAEQMTFCIGSFMVILCWELNHHLHQVLHTKRFVFAPPKGSAVAETNPSEPLLEALEESTPNSLLQYLAYLDLCMVCESNVDMWRRDAFFEETGETYKRVITACLKPLEQFTQKLAEGLETSSAENSLQLSYQLSSPTERLAVVKLYESFYDAQLCAWCARIVASLTARSRKEDRYGIAQLSGSNASVISTLLSSLLAVESLMGKKANVQSTNYLMGPAGIKWATVNTGRGESTTGAMVKIRGSPLYGKAYSLADILKVSIYCIVSAFHSELWNSSKTGLLEKDWIISDKPLYGSRELLIQKLRFFLDFQA